MKTTRRIAAVVLAAAIPFTLSACGTSQAAQAKKVIKAEILKDSGDSTNPMKMNDAQAGCFANDIVDHIGVSDLKKSGLLTTNGKNANNLSDLKVSESQATTIVNDMFTCTDNGTVVMKAFLDEMSSSMSSLPAAAQTCIKNKIDATFVKKILVAELSGGDTTALESQVEGFSKACASAS